MGLSWKRLGTLNKKPIEVLSGFFILVHLSQKACYIYIYVVRLSDQLYRLSIFSVSMLQVGICLSWPSPFSLPCWCPPCSFLPLNSPDFSQLWNINPARVPAAHIELSNPFLQVHHCYGNIINHPCEVPAR